MKKLILILLFTSIGFAQIKINEDPFAHTYSIVARDSSTGEIGVAVQSHWFSVGPIVAWGESGVGVIATQSFVNVSFGPRGLALLKEGLSPEQAVKKMIDEDEGRDFRQLAILDKDGNSYSYTGSKCVEFASNIHGNNYSVQANMMLNSTVPKAMEASFNNSSGLPLAERLVLALEAAENEGGDIRGKQSASLLVLRGESTGKPWADKIVDLRVDDHKNPLEELKRLLKVNRAYEHMNNGDLAVEVNDMETALREYSLAEEMFPGNEEMLYWRAVTLANNGMLEDALPLFKTVFEKNMNWHIMTPRITKNGLLTVDEESLNKILGQVK